MNILRSLVLVATFLLLNACSDTATAEKSDAISRPSFSMATDEAFDSAQISGYAGHHASVYSYIDAHQDQHLAHIQRWLRQRSISAQDDGIAEMAQMLRDDLDDIGFVEAEIVPTDGHPGVWGYYDAGAEKTLVVYMMYDVQPVNEADWESPPFAAELVNHELGKVLMARGATNQKGPQRAFLNAVQSVISATGTLPVNLMIAAEGEEELGSPHYPQIVDRYEARMRTADGVLFPFNSQRPDGQVSLILGVKGIIYFELEARGSERGGPVRSEIHGSYKAAVDSPTWRLIQALASLTSPDGNTILVPGYYDDVRAPTLAEQKLLNGVARAAVGSSTQKLLGVERWIDGLEGTDALLELLYQPSLNIDGLWSGYTGEGVKTILPHIATAKVDSRLPPDIDPDAALDKIRKHLDAGGFDDVILRKLSGYPAAQTSVDAPAVQAVISVFNKYASATVVQPRVAGSAPFFQFTQRLNLPLVPAGLGFGHGAHGPNEIMLIEPASNDGPAGLAEIEKSYVDFLYALAGDQP